MVLAARILVAVGFLACISMPARAPTALSLPSPTGPSAIGAVSLHLVDGSRWDPFAPARTHRSLMVTLWYPARQSTSPAAAYLDDGVARVVDSEMDVPAGTFEPARSHARVEPLLGAPEGRRYPVVIYSPGYGSWRNASTALTEDLVSHGFVVVTIDHPYDAAAVEFPNHVVVKTKPFASNAILTYESWYAIIKPLLAVRVADVNFVIDELAALDTGKNPDAEGHSLPENLKGALDLHRIGMFGHSLGGTTVVQVLREGSRIRAGLSLDGPVPPATGTACTQHPFMLIRSVDPALERFTVPSYRAATPTLCGWHSAVALNGSGHNDFSDLTIFARQLALDKHRRAMWSLGSINADTAIAAERTYIVNFFERWLN
jgi:predicted dienelactone hydrolase